jgi:CCR4-NOT transcriptional complex subunit CAF120
MGGSQVGGFDPMMAQQQAMQAAQMAYMNALQQAHEGSVVGHGSPGAAPASAMGMQTGMPFVASPHMSMMGAPYPGFMAQSGMGNSEYNGATSPSQRPNKPNGQN